MKLCNTTEALTQSPRMRVKETLIKGCISEVLDEIRSEMRDCTLRDTFALLMKNRVRDKN